MDPLLVTALVSIVGSVSGLIGVVIGSKVSAAATDRAARAAERQHFRDLGMQVAMTNYDHAMKIAQAAANRYHETFHVPPLKAFVIQGIKLMEVVSDSSLSTKAMIRKIAESEDFAKAIADAAKKHENKETEQGVDGRRR